MRLNTILQSLCNKAFAILVVLCIYHVSVTEAFCGQKDKVVHHGYARIDHLLSCVSGIFGRTAIRDPFVQDISFVACPQTRDGVIALLKEKGLSLFETGDWLYVINSNYFDQPLPGSRKLPKWSRIRIEPRINPFGDPGFTEKEQSIIAERVFQQARMIPLYADLGGRIEGEDEIPLIFNIKFSRKRLRSDAPDSVLLMMEQIIEQVPTSGMAIGRLIFGNLNKGDFEILWDSRLFVGQARVSYNDVNGDGWEEIVVKSETGGNVSYPIWVIFDKDGKEITRQKKCDLDIVAFTEEDGVCALFGVDISFSGQFDGPKDVEVYGWEDRFHETTIFKLQNGMYVPQLPKASPKEPKQKSTKPSNPSVK